MQARLANLNDYAVLFLSRAVPSLCMSGITIYKYNNKLHNTHI